MADQKGRRKYLSIAKGAFGSFKEEVKKGSLNAYPIYALLQARIPGSVCVLVVGC
jgi:hypothetical protein